MGSCIRTLCVRTPSEAEKKEQARSAEQKKLARDLRKCTANTSITIITECENNFGKSDDTAEAAANMSRISLMCNLIGNHAKGERIDLGPVKKEYSELHRNGSTFVWDIDRMTTDLTMANWDGICYDGLDDRASDRDEIGLVILKALIANGTDINTITTYGRTALQTAALAGDLEYCKELIKLGADIRGKDEAGVSTLSLVKQWHNQPRDLRNIITYLESLGCD